MRPASPEILIPVFVGSMDWLPNVDGVLYFVRDTVGLISIPSSQAAQYAAFLAFKYVVDLSLMAQIEGYCSIDLLQAKRGKVVANGFRRFAVKKSVNHGVQ
jgi:hypothetical protein